MPQISLTGFSPLLRDNLARLLSGYELEEAQNNQLGRYPLNMENHADDAAPHIILRLTGSADTRRLNLPCRIEDLRYQLTHLAAMQPHQLAENLIFHPNTQRLQGPSGDIALTEKESALLAQLYQAGGTLISKNQLLSDIWGYDQAAQTHTLETHIYRLRGKLEEAGGFGAWLVATPEGYAFRQ